MTPERNAPCPCGSGKKYKKCCGQTAAPARRDNVAIHRTVAYAGDIGRKREAFCLEYLAVKENYLQKIEEGFEKDTQEMQKPISCFKGCSACCSYFITATLQECEVIVYHLYQNPQVLAGFLRSFPGWQEQVKKIGKTFNLICQLSNRTILGQETPEERGIFNTESALYAMRRIACPFLAENECTIHAVRPYVCAGVVSVSPPEWCRLDHPQHSDLTFVKTQFPYQDDMPYFVRPKSGLLFANMPSLVNDLLTEGYGVFARIPGLEAMARAIVRDPAVTSTLRQAGLI